MDILLICLLCVAATAVGAISGIGGGIIIKPVLDAVSGLPTAAVSFLSGCTVLAMSTVSLLHSRKDLRKARAVDTEEHTGDPVDARRLTVLALSASVGGLLGKQIFEWVRRTSGNDGLVGMIQNILLVALTLGVFLYMLRKETIRTMELRNLAACGAVGLALGTLSSFMGIGGGPINLVVLHYFFSMQTKPAALSSIYIIFFSQIASIATTLLQGNMPSFQPLLLVGMALCGVAGGFLGRSLSKRMSDKHVDKLFYGMLVVITCISGSNAFRFAGMLG